ncbi:hypothetical protein CXF72_14355 [Psychromonas sp. MB-3u-54]|uniref:dual OB domain-containing protein n=1 Tax=Psychromonas sp. MB-3u-54 TaxID=2058319 RepID=UPI000C324B0C|nr:hypothetical protein [Psychromonas sp. MB-3u-54]PKH01863.1 hypothetical protein CXF72_14355 [Psychromonas sp. MB-3u-54]
MSQVEIIVLANSVKHQQHCVAGKSLANGQWVRPVSSEIGGELSHNQAKYQNPYGIFTVKPLQKILMKFSRHVPLSHQPENYLIDNTVWRQNYSINLNEINNHLDHPNDLWGESNLVPYIQIQLGTTKIEQSLYLVKVDNIKLYIKDDKRKASFTYNRIAYELPVTDPNFGNLVDDFSGITGVLCISLGEEFKGNCYKLVATIF